MAPAQTRSSSRIWLSGARAHSIRSPIYNVYDLVEAGLPPQASVAVETQLNVLFGLAHGRFAQRLRGLEVDHQFGPVSALMELKVAAELIDAASSELPAILEDLLKMLAIIGREAAKMVAYQRAARHRL